MQEPQRIAPTSITSTSLLAGLMNPDNRTIWRQFVERYRPVILRYARRLGLADEDAQDTAQETLLAFAAAYPLARTQTGPQGLKNSVVRLTRRSHAPTNSAEDAST